jgi:hypothetical protein
LIRPKPVKRSCTQNRLEIWPIVRVINVENMLRFVDIRVDIKSRS